MLLKLFHHKQTHTHTRSFSLSLFPASAELQVESQPIIKISGNILEAHVKESVSVHIQTALRVGSEAHNASDSHMR